MRCKYCGKYIPNEQVVCNFCGCIQVNHHRNNRMQIGKKVIDLKVYRPHSRFDLTKWDEVK